jgi:hypothetical protein
MDAANQMGPMARADLRDSLHKQVAGSIAAGARVLCGGRPKEGKGAFYLALSQEQKGPKESGGSNPSAPPTIEVRTTFPALRIFVQLTRSMITPFPFFRIPIQTRINTREFTNTK